MLRAPGPDEEDADTESNVLPTEAATEGKTKGEAADGPSLQLWVVETSRPPETPVYPPLVIQKGPGPLYLQGGARGLEKKGG